MVSRGQTELAAGALLARLGPVKMALRASRRRRMAVAVAEAAMLVAPRPERLAAAPMAATAEKARAARATALAERLRPMQQPGPWAQAAVAALAF